MGEPGEGQQGGGGSREGATGGGSRGGATGGGDGGVSLTLKI